MPLYSSPSSNAVQKTLTSILAAGNVTSAALSDVVGIPNLPGVMVIDRVNTANVATPSIREYIAYTGTSGSTVTGLTRNVDNGGTDQAHAVGAIVEFVPDVTWASSIYTALSNLVSTSTLAVDTSKVVTPSSLNTALASVATISNKYFVNATLTGYINFSGASISGIMTPSSTDTLTNKTLTSPKIGTYILDTNGNELAVLTATGSAVNEITLANAATGNSPQISATGGDTNISLDLRGKGAGVTKGGIRYQSNTTNSNQNGVYSQSGWGFILGDGDTSCTESVTFPTAFTTILSVVAVGIGYKDSSDPSGIGDFADYGLYANVNSISTSGFTVSLNIPSGSIGATRRVGYSWIAYGI